MYSFSSFAKKHLTPEANKLLRNKEYIRKTIVSIIITLLFFVGLFASILSIDLYRETIIDSAITVSIYIGVGLFMIPFTYSTLRKHIQFSPEDLDDEENPRGAWKNRMFNNPIGKHILLIFYNIVVFGGLSVYAFLALNMQFATGIEVQHLMIERTGELASSSNAGKPYAIIRMNNQEKQIVFTPGYEVEEGQHLTLTLSRGVFGYYVIIGKPILS